MSNSRNCRRGSGAVARNYLKFLRFGTENPCPYRSASCFERVSTTFSPYSFLFSNRYERSGSSVITLFRGFFWVATASFCFDSGSGSSPHVGSFSRAARAVRASLPPGHQDTATWAPRSPPCRHARPSHATRRAAPSPPPAEPWNAHRPALACGWP